MTDAWASPPRKHLVSCFFCERAQNATEVGVTEDYNPDHQLPTRATLVRCDACDGPLLFLQEDVGNGLDDDDLVRVWPAPVRQLSNAIPEELRRVHGEARVCYDAKAYTAVVVMVGRTLEGVCIKNGVSRYPLQKGLKELNDKGLIDARLLEWTTELRVLRNEGAHFTENPVLREDARDALQLCEALLDYLYVLTARFEEFKARRHPSKDAPAAGSAAEGGS